MKTRWLRRTVGALLTLTLAYGGLRAQESEPGPMSVTEAGNEAESPPTWHWSVSSGYGWGVDISSAATFLGDVRFVGVAPAVGRTVKDRMFRDRWYAGRIDVTAEGAFLPSLKPRPGFGAGASLNARYLVTSPGGWAPFLSVGAGPMVLNFNHGDQSDGLSFILQGGVGVEHRLAPSVSLLTQLRLHHMSNAGLRRPNPGINDVLFLVGFTRYVR
jgi:lipid A 3-O-deacylase